MERTNVGSVMYAIQSGQGRRTRRTRRRRGRGFFGKVWNGIKKAANYVKDKKLISKIANLIPHPAAKAVGTAASAVGLGRLRTRRTRRAPVRRRRRIVRRRGGASGLRKFLTNAHSFIKQRRLVSGALKHFGQPGLARVAYSLGYGRTTRRRTRRTRR